MSGPNFKILKAVSTQKQLIQHTEASSLISIQTSLFQIVILIHSGVLLANLGVSALNRAILNFQDVLDLLIRFHIDAVFYRYIIEHIIITVSTILALPNR